jgi:hypothetical protein
MGGERNLQLGELVDFWSSNSSVVLYGVKIYWREHSCIYIVDGWVTAGLVVEASFQTVVELLKRRS